IGVSEYLSTTALALSPAGLDSTATEMVPSAPWNTVVAMSLSLLALLEVHDDLHEIDREGGLEEHRHDRLAGDLLGPGRGHVELVGGQHLVQDHAGEEAVQGRLERRPHPDVVEPSDVGVGADPHPGLGVVDDPAHRDLAEGAGVGGDPLERP